MHSGMGTKNKIGGQYGLDVKQRGQYQYQNLV